VGLVSSSFGQASKPKPKTRILFILDGSGSMLNLWEGKPRMVIAKEILNNIATKLNKIPNVQMGLRVYGHLYPDNCKDSRLEVPFSSSNLLSIREKLGKIKPKGKTPITYALEKAGYDFPLDPNSRNIIILITDGFESCEGDPCATSLSLQKKGVILKPFVFGMNLGADAFKKFDCIGTFYNVNTTQSFKTILNKVVNNSIQTTTTQIDLLDINKRATETDVNMTIYDNTTNIARYNFYHTITHRGISDTLPIDPITNYDIVVHTRPEVIKKDVHLDAEKHNVIKISTPQGAIKLNLLGNTINNNLDNKIKCLIKKAGTNSTIDVLGIDREEKFLVGKYDVEILTLPRIKMKNLVVSQSKTTKIEIQAPGILTLLRSYQGYGGVFSMEKGKLIKIYSLNLNSKRETIALQPGKYTVIFRSKYSKKLNATVERTFEVSSGSSVLIKL